MLFVLRYVCAPGAHRSSTWGFLNGHVHCIFPHTTGNLYLVRSGTHYRHVINLVTFTKVTVSSYLLQQPQYLEVLSEPCN